MAEPRDCPQCGVRMEFRLGEYDCPQCGHVEAQVKETQKPEGSGPGFRQNWQTGGGPTRPGAVPPPPPAAGTTYQPGQSVPGASPYEGPGYSSAHPPSDGLTIEKHIYFGIQVFSYLILTIGMLALSPSEMGLGPEFDEFAGGAVIGSVIAAVIGLGILAFVLYGTEIWSKWCCGGCAVFGLLGTIPAMFAGASGYGGGPWAFIQMLFSIWFISILWRDIQRLKG